MPWPSKATRPANKAQEGALEGAFFLAHRAKTRQAVATLGETNLMAAKTPYVQQTP
jgi:hypothetical protein